MPVWTLMTVTFALGIAAPAGTVIVPLIVPVMVWPITAWANRRITAKPQRRMNRVRSFANVWVLSPRSCVWESRMMGSNVVSMLQCVAIGYDRCNRCQDKDG